MLDAGKVDELKTLYSEANNNFRFSSPGASYYYDARQATSCFAFIFILFA